MFVRGFWASEHFVGAREVGRVVEGLNRGIAVVSNLGEMGVG